MTQTEERLRDYLGAVANLVGQDNTRPLTPLAGRTPARRAIARRPTAPADGRHGWRGWAIPLASAACVLAIVSLSVALTRHLTAHRPAVAVTETAGPLPAYYVEIEYETSTSQAVVRSVATGAVIARVPNPSLSSLINVAAAPDDRTFYAVYESAAKHRLTIYSFRVTGPGKVTMPAPIRGGVVTYADRLTGIPALAVSPGGGTLAMTLSTAIYTPGFLLAQHVLNEIVLIDLRAGVQHAWAGGLNRAGFTVTVGSPSWTEDGRSLDFLATWCARGGHLGGACTSHEAEPGSTSQVRSLTPGTLAAGGGSLGASALLMNQPGYVSWMVAAGGDRVDLLVLKDRKQAGSDPAGLAIEQYSAADDRLRGVLYIHNYGVDGLSLFSSGLTADPADRHLLLALTFERCSGSTCSSLSTSVGWIDGGSYRALASYGNVQSQASW